MVRNLVDDVSALQVSSNVYMFNVAIRLAGSSYVEKEPLAVADLQGTLNLMRSYYSMFGLGNKTGVDVPNESSSYMGYGSEPGMLLNYSIGQFDMYTQLMVQPLPQVVIYMNHTLWLMRQKSIRVK